MKKTLVLLGTLMLSYALYGQQYTTKPSSLPCFNKEFSVVAHIVRDSLGAINLTAETIDSALLEVNEFFAPICISFNLCELRIIEEVRYSVIDNADEWREMEVKYLEDQRINFFFVRDADWEDEGAFCKAPVGGIVDNQSTSSLLFSACSSLGIAHELGHFFGLLHTFDTENGEELVNGANCLSAGDLVCDTPADPYDEDRPVEEYIDAECRFINTSTDANGQFYTPHVGNIMSYYPPNCQCGFTHGQFLRMADHYRRAPVKYW